MFFFFFKQKTAYEIMPSLVGSEMCIRDSLHARRDDEIQRDRHQGGHHEHDDEVSVSSHWVTTSAARRGPSGTREYPTARGGATRRGRTAVSSRISDP